MSHDTKKHIGIGNFILYIYIYISNQGLLGNVVGKTLEDVGKAPKNCFQETKGCPKQYPRC
jgi:hypothetical protein